ncbi:MAG: hypothetical protein PHD20_04875 [Clostridia bacterium]|nr:hypothetical protein [Clostridia bacterium]
MDKNTEKPNKKESITTKGNEDFFGKIKSYFKKIINKNSINNNQKNLEIEKAESIINELSINKEYDVYSMPAFRQLVSNEISKDSRGVIHSLDINDLYKANKKKSRGLVDNDIKELINSIKEIIYKYNKNENSYITKRRR